MIFHNSVCFITQYFSNCTSCEEVDGSWRHAQIRIHLQGFSAGLCWAQAVLPLLYVISSSVIREVKGTSVLYISDLSILDPVVLCPSLVSEGMFDI